MGGAGSGPPPPSPELVARAYELHLEGCSLVRVAEHLTAETGRRVARSTVYEWVKQARSTEVYIELFERAEEVQRSSLRLDIALGIVVDALRTRGSDPVEVAKVIVKIEERRARLLGLDAPTRVSVEDSTTPPEVDPATVAAVRAMRQENAEKYRRLLEQPELPSPGDN